MRINDATAVHIGGVSTNSCANYFTDLHSGCTYTISLVKGIMLW